MTRKLKGFFAISIVLAGVAAMAQQIPSASVTSIDTAQAPPAEQPGAIKASEIVQRADEIRFPKGGFQVEVVVTSTTGGESQEARHYRIYSKGNDNTIIQTLEPRVERGQNLLMKGRDLWVFVPSVSQPVRLSLSQRLTGQVANGDLARLSFSADYIPRVARIDTIAGREHYVLELTAAERSTTYPKIVYWVRVSDNQPYKAEFYALSGRLLKTCRYENYQPLGGPVRPTRLVMTDALKAGDESVLVYSRLVARDIPDRMFTKDYLKKLE